MQLSSLFTVGFCLLLRTQTKTNKRTQTHTQTHVVLSCSVGLPTHEAKKRNRTRPIHVQIWLRQILWDDRSYCSCLTAARYFHKVHLHIQNSIIEKPNNQSIIRQWDIINKDSGSTYKIRYRLLLLIHWPLFYAERNHNLHWPVRVRMPQTKPAAERPFVTGNPPSLPIKLLIHSHNSWQPMTVFFFVFICNFRNILPKM
jgi:hypothetical protein